MKPTKSYLTDLCLLRVPIQKIIGKSIVYHIFGEKLDYKVVTENSTWCKECNSSMTKIRKLIHKILINAIYYYQAKKTNIISWKINA